MAGTVRLAYVGMAGAAAALLALAGCGRNYFFEARDSWRREAEVACLKSGAIRESQVLLRAEPINGPGMCGADYPLKVTALGESAALAYTGSIRPPATIPSGYPAPARVPAARNYAGARADKPVATVDPSYMRTAAPAASAPSSEPLSIVPQNLVPRSLNEQARDLAVRPATPGYASAPPAVPARRRSIFDPPSANDIEGEDDPYAVEKTGPPRTRAAPPSPRPERPASPLRGPHTPFTGTVRPVEIKPTATLACPIVSALDRWIIDSIQPSALRWFGQPVAEIRQISAYSCRGMNGQRGARISEHAFGNALDIASFVLVDGRKITVKNGWHGTPEEQGFLRDVQGAACEQFTTVLAPGSNRFHYDHIHVDLMRRASGRAICNPDAVPGEVVAARVAKERGYARRGEPAFTGSIASAKTAKDKTRAKAKPKLKNLFRPDEDEEDWVEHDGPRERDD